MAIEVEIRSFVTKEQYTELLNFFRKNAKFINEDDQVTHYFDAKEDLRIQQNNSYSKIWMKKGKVHDEQREEVEVKVAKEDFNKLEKVFTAAGLKTQIKWFRKRHAFKWQDIDVAVDFTKGYGYILELEKLSSEEDQNAALELLKNKLKELNIPLTPREEFDQKYAYYKEHWKELV
ncbi:MAG TPA: CYTH domain-containing protein [Candidatus Nanoarchaeia archaeon]|nr:CYTH domain-containing protein [Candidatus Nanoarchaeia archaeon]